MRATLQVDNQFGDDGPQRGTRLVVSEVRKVDGEFWAQVVRLVGQDMYESYTVKLDHLMIPHTEHTETYWSTQP